MRIVCRTPRSWKQVRYELMNRRLLWGLFYNTPVDLFVSGKNMPQKQQILRILPFVQEITSLGVALVFLQQLQNVSGSRPN